MKISNLTYNPKWTAIIIVLLFLISLFIEYCINNFINEERTFYIPVLIFRIGLTLISLGLSFAHPFIVVFSVGNWKKHLIWIIFGALPMIWFNVAVIISQMYYPM